MSGASDIGRLVFSDSGGDPGQLAYVNSSNNMVMNVNSEEVMRVLSNGSYTLTNSGAGEATLSIKNSNASTPQGLTINFSGGAPNNETQTIINTYDTGATRFRVWSNGDAENANNSYGGTSDIKLKTDIEDARDYWDDFKQIRFRKFKKKTDVEQFGEDARSLFGVVAQEAELVFPGLVSNIADTEEREFPVLDSEDNATYELDKDGNSTPITETKTVDLGTTTKTFRYSILSQIGLKVVQELQTRLEAAEAKIAALESA